MESENGIKSKFSVGLGLFDYINPILYGITVITILKHMHGVMPSGLFCHVLGVGTGMLLGILACTAVIIAFLWHKTGTFNTAAVLIGAVGYLMLYASLITMSVRADRSILVILYALAICLFVFLCLVGILANLKDAKVHWVIEISNVVCQMSVAVATILLFL